MESICQREVQGSEESGEVISIVGRHKTCPYIESISVGATLVVALSSRGCLCFGRALNHFPYGFTYRRDVSAKLNQKVFLIFS